MTRWPTRRRRGYLLLEMMITLALVGVVAGVATRMMMQLLTVGRELSGGERTGLAVDRVANALRIDVGRAARLVGQNGTLELDGTVWSIDGDAVVRTQGDQVERYGPLPGPIGLTVTNRAVSLRLGAAEWAFAPVLSEGSGE